MNPLSSPLLTDYYQLTMLQSYLEQGMEDLAVFEFYVHKLPRRRGYLRRAGMILSGVLTPLRQLRFFPLACPAACRA